MNIQAYIESGKLELYVSGALTAQEMREVERMAIKHPEVKKELDEIELGILNFNNSLGQGPKEDLKERLLNAVKLSAPANNIKKFERTTELKIVENKTEEMTNEPIISKVGKKSKFNFALAACIILLIASSIGLYTIWNNLKATELELSQLKEENKNANTKFANLVVNLEEAEKELSIVKNPDFVKLILNGMPISPTSQAVIHWNKSNNTVMIDLMQLPLEDKQHEYQLWAIVKGQPVDLGIFSVSNSTENMVEMKPIEGAEAFAVSLEPKGGSVNPTINQIYLMGKVI